MMKVNRIPSQTEENIAFGVIVQLQKAGVITDVNMDMVMEEAVTEHNGHIPVIIGTHPLRVCMKRTVSEQWHITFEAMQ